MKTKLYIAGSSAEIDIVERYMRSIEASGLYEITCDWISAMRRNPPDAQCTRDLLRGKAIKDLQGVQDASIVWLMSSENASRGACTEFGYALALRKMIIVSGHRSVFTSLVPEFATHDDALAWLLRERGLL